MKHPYVNRAHGVSLVNINICVQIRNSILYRCVSERPFLGIIRYYALRLKS